MEKRSKLDLTALLAMLGIATGSAASIQPSALANNNDNGALFVAEKQPLADKGKQSACGKGSCGTDAKGAAAAKSKHNKKDAKADSSDKAASDKGASADKSGK